MKTTRKGVLPSSVRFKFDISPFRVVSESSGEVAAVLGLRLTFDATLRPLLELLLLLMLPVSESLGAGSGTGITVFVDGMVKTEGMGG